MSTVKIVCKDGEVIVTDAEEMHYNEDLLEVYAPHSELKAVVHVSKLKTAYITEKKSKK